MRCARPVSSFLCRSRVRRPLSPRPASSHPGIPTGFSLVELLIVVGILAGLIALLLPALNRARRHARTASCLSNVRQLGIAFTMYASANRGRSLAYDPTYRTFWMNQLRPEYAGVDAVRLCPEATTLSYGWGGAFTAWGPDPDPVNTTPANWFFGPDYGSYGFNAWLHDVTRTKLRDYPVYLRLNDPRSQRIPVFADANWVDGWPSVGTDTPPADLVHGGNPRTAPSMQRFCIARHGHGVNVVFLDGHAEYTPLEGLWTLQWGNDSRPRAVTVPQ